MTTTRREFLDRLGAGAVSLAGLPIAMGLGAPSFAAAAPHASADWDLSWTKRITGKHRVILDVPAVESGYGVWRATFWAKQYQDVLGVTARDTSTVLVLRHNAIALAMQQSFWDKYGIGKRKNVTHPLTQEPTDRNPALLTAKDGVPAPYDSFALPALIERGGIVLACDLALQDCIQLIQSTDKVSPEVARKQALAALVPGVILQPSGVFAALRAQDFGCTYLRAS